MKIEKILKKLNQKLKKELPSNTFFNDFHMTKSKFISEYYKFIKKIKELKIKKNFIYETEYTKSGIAIPNDIANDQYSLYLCIGHKHMEYICITFDTNVLNLNNGISSVSWSFTNWKTGKSFSKNTFEDFKKEIEKNQDLYFSLEED